MLTYKIKYQNQVFNCRYDETLIDAFNRHGIEVNFSCKKGSCHICMLQCNTGIIPEKSQLGLKSEYISNHYFLPCSCIPTSDMSILDIPSTNLYQSGIIYKKTFLSPDICKILIEPTNDFKYQSGQYINLRRINDGAARSYSLVSHPDDYFIEIHVKKMPGGKLSSWIFDELETGSEIEYQGAMGDCCYNQVIDKNTSLIFIGKGTGIAPLYGIVLDALKNKHSGSISIFHEGQTKNDIYLHDNFVSLDKQHETIDYTACVEKNIDGSYFFPHSSLDLLENTIDSILNNSNNPAVFTAGSPEFVKTIKALLRHHKVSDENIFSDSFDYKDLRSSQDRKSIEVGRRRNDPTNINKTSTAKQLLSRDDEMWDALDNGKKLKTILDDFYSQVYKDDKLSGFFRNSTKQRSSEKQYLFMRQIFTGEKVYFGDRPKNAHHWMVIDDELFNYRESILIKSLRDHGLAENLIQRWVSHDESFRQDIVKKTAFPKVINGIEQPLNGYETLMIDEGTICDGCQGAIERGETVRYHIRLGSTYCHACMELTQPEQAV